MKSHPKTHEADIEVGEGLHGLHPAHVRPEVEDAGKPVLMGHRHPRNQNDSEAGMGMNDGPRPHDPKDKKLRS